MEENKTKKCSLCEQELSLERFYTYTKSGNPWAYCRTCHYEKYTKKTKYAWDAKNPERKKELDRKHSRAWVEKNRERYNENMRNWYKKRNEQKNGNKNM